MSYDFSAGMAEAARLTREGRVAEATALIQKTLGPTQEASPDMGQKPAESAAAHARDVIDLVPPRDPAGPWSVAGGMSEQAEPAARRSSATLGWMHGLVRKGPAAPVPAGARFEEQCFSSSVGTRNYKLYVPHGHAGKALPLVVMLHGCKQSPDDFAAGTRMNELAEEIGFLVAYPEQPRSANPGKCWNWFNAGDQTREGGEPALIAGITRRIIQDNAVDATRVYAAGLSAGGAAAAILGETYPDLFAAICVHSGLSCGAARDMPSAFTAMSQGGKAVLSGRGKAVPAIVFHSDSDNVVSPINGEQVIAQFQGGQELNREVIVGRSQGGVDFTRTIHSDQSGLDVLEHWLLRGMGHAWSGGSSAGSFTDPRGPDASRETLRFFLTHSKPPA